MSIVPTVQSTATTPSPSTTPPFAGEVDQLQESVRDVLQNDASIAQAAQGAPTPQPSIAAGFEQDVQQANADSAELATMVQTVIAGKAEAKPETAPKTGSKAVVEQSPVLAEHAQIADAQSCQPQQQLSPTLKHVLETYIDMQENPLSMVERTSEKIQERLATVQHLQEQLDNEPDRMSAVFLHAELATLEDHLGDDLESVGMANLLREELGEALKLPSAKLSLESLVSNLLPRVMYMYEVPGMGLRAPELHTLLNEAAQSIIQIFAEQCGEQAAYLPSLSRDNLLGLGRLVMQAEEDAPDMLRALNAAYDGLCQTRKPQNAATRMNALIGDMLHAEEPGARLDSVDSLFRFGYPEEADLALQIKYLVVDDAEKRLGVEAQHALAVGLHGIKNGPDVNRSGGVLAQTASTKPVSQLTPEIVGELTKLEPGKINYQLAHLVLLQSTAQAFGCLVPQDVAPDQPDQPDQPAQPGNRAPVAPLPQHLTSEEMGNTLSEAEATKWCEALGMNGETAAYTAQLATAMSEPGPEPGPDVRAVDHLLQASLLYQKGLAGTQAADKAAHVAHKVGRMATHRDSERHALNLYASNAAVGARLALDRYLVGLSGLDAKGRLEAPEESLVFKGAAVNDAITDRLKKSLAEAEGRAKAASEALAGNGEEGPAPMADRHSELLKALRGHRHDFVSHYKQAQELFHVKVQGPTNANDPQAQVKELMPEGLLQARAQRAEVKAERTQQAANRRLLGHNWAHLKNERKQARDMVLELDGLRHGTLNDGVVDSEARKQELLRELGKFDPYTFTRVKHGQAIAEEEMEKTLEIMLPRAKALEYFAGNGKLHYQKERRKSLYALNSLRLQEFHFKQTMRNAYGKDTYQLVRGAVEAAALTAFLEQRCTPSEFSMTDAGNVQKVMEQLDAWGLKVKGDDAVLTPLVYRTLHKVTLGDGTLNFAKLRKHGESLSRDLVATGLRDNKQSRLEAHKNAKKAVLHSADAAIRKEGIRGLMDNVAQPGAAMIVDRTRGVLVDTGSLFASTNTVRLALRSVRSPIGVQLQFMHSNSLGIIRTAEGYQVLLKDKAMASAALNVTAALTGRLKVSFGGGAGGEKMEGMALDFVKREDCEQFLLDFMNPASALHKPEEALRSLHAADQIRFLSENNRFVQGSLGITASLLAVPLSQRHAAAVAASAAVSAKHTHSHEVRHNALGQSLVMSNTYMVSASAGVGVSVLNTQAQRLASAGRLSVNRGVTYTVTERFTTESGPGGVKPTTSFEKEYSADALPQMAFLHELPKDVQQRVRADAELMDRLYRVGRNASPGTSVTVHCPIRREVLEQIKTLRRTIRIGSEDAAEQAHKDMHALIADETSYAPARLIVKTPRKEKLGKNLSPSLPLLKVVRNDTLVRMNTEVISLI